MGLNVLDFLSSSPNNYIFQKKANTTNFGGVCQMLSIVLILGFAIYYLIKYFRKDPYSIEYSSYMYDSGHDITGKDKKIEFGYEIYSKGIDPDDDGKPVSENFSLMNFWSNETINRNKSLYENISNFNFLLVYECQDDKCEIKENFF